MSNGAAQPLLSIVVPCFNEAAGLRSFHDSLVRQVEQATKGNFEIIYCNDGSRDDTAHIAFALQKNDKRIKLLSLTRNFGKEIATSAGIAAARGKAVLMLDADGQHPVELIPSFVQAWRQGAKVVVGVRRSNQNEGFIKRYGSKLFYIIFNKVTGIQLTPGASDFRLIDRSVQQQFVRLSERNRITRGLIDWLGYEQLYIPFDAKARTMGDAAYSYSKLVKLAIDSVVSLSISPLHITAYIGAFVLPISALLGIGMAVNWLTGDPLQLQATGGAYVMVLMLFLIGILLVSQGIIGLYLSHIHAEAQNRPLYVVDEQQSVGIPRA